jgi:hypothetical protein
MRLTIAVSIALIVLTLLAVPAGATMEYYTSQSAWAAATSGVFVIDFNDVVVPSSPGYVDYSITGLQLHDVTFTANPATDEFYVVDSAFGPDSYRNSFAPGNYLRGSTWQTRYFQAALPDNVNALAMLVLTDNRGGKVTFSFSTGDSKEVQTLNSATPYFVGFTFDQSVQWVKVDSDQNFTALDNFAYGETPETGTILLGGIGLAALWAARRLRRFC